MGKSLSDISIIDLLPASIANDETIKAAAHALDSELQSIHTSVESISKFTNFDTMIEPMLTHLAIEFSAEGFDGDLPVEKKRSLVKNAIALHNRKGTPSSIEEAVSDVLGNGVVEEWWKYGGDPYHFKITVDITDIGMTNQSLSWAENLIHTHKNVRSILEKMDIYLAGRGKTASQLTCQSGEEVSVLPWIQVNLSESGLSVVAMGKQSVETVWIYPYTES